mgnify:FL=1
MTVVLLLQLKFSGIEFGRVSEYNVAAYYKLSIGAQNSK